MNHQEMDRYARNFVKNTCSSIFAMPDEQKGILYAIAKNGPQILSEIEHYVKSYGKYGLETRWAIRRRLDGTSSFFGLVPYEYLDEKENDAKIRGPVGMMYCLTTKGMLSILTNVPIEKNYLFKKYVKFLKSILDRKIITIGSHENTDTDLDEKTKIWLLDLFKNYIKYKIYSFLIWHDANDVLLRHKTNFTWYLDQFFNRTVKSIAAEIPKNITERTLKNYRKILRRCLLYEKKMHAVDTIFDEQYSSNIPKEKFIPLRDNLAMISDYVIHWYYYFDKIQLVQNRKKPYSVKPIPAILIKEPETGIDLEFVGKSKYKKRTSPDLRKITTESIRNGLGVNIPVDKIWNKEFESPKMTKWGRIPT